MTWKPCTRCGGTGREVDWAVMGARIRAARIKRGWSLRELARRVECSPAYVTDLEHGRRGGGLSGEKTRAILAKLDVPIPTEPETGDERDG